MPYEEIWAPWRHAYVSAEEKKTVADTSQLRFMPGADENCFLCQAVADTPENDRNRLVVWRGERVIVVINKFPYNNGHLLVTPTRHVARPDLLEPEEHLELMNTISRLIQIEERTMNAQGFNVGLNMGAVAGAGLPGHMHWHIVPRWNGDTNFMPTLACINVISQSLESLWEVLHREMNS